MGRMRDRHWWDWECVVCGRRYAEQPPNHKCPKRVIAAIEAAHRRAADLDDEDSDDLPTDMDPRQYSFDQRLADGFALMKGDDECS